MKKNIAIVTGGYSGEAVISYRSAEAIFTFIDKERYNCFAIDIRTDGWFYMEDENAQIDKNDFSLNIDGRKIMFDCALIALHGTPGEDGKLQGYFDCIGMRYTSCSASSSAITFNKKYTIALAARSGLDVANSVAIDLVQPYDVNDIAERLNFPVFVKPNSGGSSLGMSKVNELGELEEAIAKAFHEDDTVLIENYIKGRELTIGVYKSKGEVITLPITEIITENEFFDFEAKYEGKSKEVTPAEVPVEMANAISLATKKAYAVFQCNGVVRIDFIYDAVKQKPFMLEINTVPGQSAASIVPQQVLAAGMSLEQFYTLLIEECFE